MNVSVYQESARLLTAYAVDIFTLQLLNIMV